jgi:hypothetical protein
VALAPSAGLGFNQAMSPRFANTNNRNNNAVPLRVDD